MEVDESPHVELDSLRARLAETEEALRAIRHGEVDGVVVEGPAGPQVFTLRSAEHPYRMLVEQMEEGAATLTPAGDVLYCNRRLAELAALPAERIVGGPVVSLLVPEDRPAVAALVRAGHGKHRGRLAAGAPVYLSVSTFQADGLERRCLVATDLGELLSTQAARAQAEAASRAKDEFLATLGHELRNPIGAISAAVAVLGRVQPNGAQAARAHEVIARQTEHLTRLVGDLLDLTRAIAGKVSLTREPVDLADLVARCVSTLRAAQRTEAHAISVELDPAWVEGDATRLEQVVVNLLSNAVKFTPAGGAIRVGVRPEGGEAVVRVADTGAGIPPDLLPHVFDSFVQGERGAERVAAGLGIGLAVVRRFVELHGGRVEASSAGSGLGSVFTVRLPLEPRPSLPAAPAASPAATERRRVVLVEDNPDSREMMRVVLELGGHEVHDAEDGLRGVDLIRRVDPDVALVDLGLPGIDGFEVARRVRAHPGGARPLLVALTGYGEADDRRRALEAGFDEHVVKPVEPERLTALFLRTRPRR